ncbi:hypothetical protein DM82_4839 [Burkholderia oklahomensis]|uniref:Uncharacterized protein n=1 Tax=Burkholderia oklahomensis TaxID=342113 RepID=A0AAJ1P5P6_9BURK|nr:hypothetical protein DM82_4839 [Burkholderia oklahomensis]AJX35519.1 hypothetical protein BG90_5754 [Burkholderia oklahomensis C6786]SUY26479.1 Uncharacterised protein [Burkholderia oklahomensis]
MRKIVTILLSAMMFASSYASADTLCKSGPITKVETDTDGNLLVTISDATYSFSEKATFSLIYSSFSTNRIFYIYANVCANGSPASRFAIR